jgi:hypothetical protein
LILAANVYYRSLRQRNFSTNINDNSNRATRSRASRTGSSRGGSNTRSRRNVARDEHVCRDQSVRARRRDNQAVNGKIKGYAIFNLDARWNFARAWALFAEVDNLFNTQYNTLGCLARTSSPGRVTPSMRPTPSTSCSYLRERRWRVGPASAPRSEAARNSSAEREAIYVAQACSSVRSTGSRRATCVRANWK